MRVQDARFQELIIAYQNTVLKAQQEVEDALIALLEGQQRAQKLAGATPRPRDPCDLAMLQYREGITDFTTVLTAEQALLTQQDNLATTLGDISRQPGGRLPGPGRRLADPRRPGFRAGAIKRPWPNAPTGASC